MDADDATEPRRFISLAETQRFYADNDYDSTAGTLWHGSDRDEDDPIWAFEDVDVVAIDPYQLIDDADDEVGHAKAESIRKSYREGAFVPPVFVIHTPNAGHPYNRIEGCHRFNAAHREQIRQITAWVAHPGCGCVDKAQGEATPARAKEE